jgi:opacity protein-like surface antigen
MSGKFAVVLALSVACIAILSTAKTHAQTASGEQVPADLAAANLAPQDQANQDQAGQSSTPQTPAAQQPDNTQASQEEIPTPRRRVHARNYRDWTFDLGAGGNLPSGTTDTFVKDGGILGTAGVARNANRILGLRLDFYWMNLPVRDSALLLASAPGAHDSLWGLTLDPIINIPVTKKYGGYVLIGPAFYHRAGKLDSSTAPPGSACNPFWTWWGACTITSIPLSGDFLKSNENEFGLNVGGGITRKMRSNIELYAEYRLMHGSNNNITTDVRPITVGVRW